MLMSSELRERLTYLFFHVENDWEVGICTKSLGRILAEGRVTDVRWFDMPRDVYWADPFLFRHDEHLFLFIEEYLKSGQYGVLRCCRLDSELNIVESRVIMDEGVHMSFPFVFEADGDILMLPETCSRGRLSLYTCIGFPWEWREHVTLLDIPCVDSVLYRDEGVWWLFYSRTDRPESLLFARRNPKLMSGWEDCDEVVVCHDARFARSGGAIQKWGDRVYRIGQNCSESYGKSVSVCAIDRFCPDYSESFKYDLQLVPAESGVSGFHTLNALGDITVVDRRRLRLSRKSLTEVLYSFKKKLF